MTRLSGTAVKQAQRFAHEPTETFEPSYVGDRFAQDCWQAVSDALDGLEAAAMGLDGLAYPQRACNAQTGRDETELQRELRLDENHKWQPERGGEDENA